MRDHSQNAFLVFYDGWCPLCQKAKKNIENADKRKKITLISFRDPEINEKYFLDGKDVESRIYSYDKITEKSYSGIYTILEIAKLIPKYRLLVPFLYISILLGFGQKVYDYIATKRNIVPVGHCDERGCEVHYRGGSEKENH